MGGPIVCSWINESSTISLNIRSLPWFERARGELRELRAGFQSVCENCLTHPKGVIPNPVSEGCRVGVRDLALVVESNQTLANHEVPQGDSPAEDGAGSLTPFGMTISSSHTPSEKPDVLQLLAARLKPCPFKAYF